MGRLLMLTMMLLSSAITMGLTTIANASSSTPSTTTSSNQLKLTKQLIQQGQSEQALIVLDQISNSEKDSSEYHFLRGRALQELKLNIDALTSYSIAIYLNKENVGARINKSLLRGALGDIIGALQELNEASLMAPNNAVIPMNRGVTYAGLNQPAKALEEFNRAIRLDRKYSDAYRNRGITRHYMRDLAGACRDWRQAAFYGDEDASEWIKFYCSKNQPQPRNQGNPHSR